MVCVYSSIIEGGRSLAIAIAITAAAITGIGVIWRKVFRPVVVTAKTSAEMWDWLERQISPGNGEGSIRDQLNRLEESHERFAAQQQVMQERQDVGAEIFKVVVDDVKKHAAAIAINSANIAELKANIGEMKALLGETVSYARQTKEVVSEVRHEQVEIAQALASDTGVTTGEHPVTP